VDNVTGSRLTTNAILAGGQAHSVTLAPPNPKGPFLRARTRGLALYLRKSAQDDGPSNRPGGRTRSLTPKRIGIDNTATLIYGELTLNPFRPFALMDPTLVAYLRTVICGL
jgi:hypothetical protein